MDNKKKDQKGFQNKKALFFILIAALIMLSFFSVMSREIKESSREEISYNKFLDMIDANQIKSVLIKSDIIEIEPMDQPNNLYKVTYYI